MRDNLQCNNGIQQWQSEDFVFFRIVFKTSRPSGTLYRRRLPEPTSCFLLLPGSFTIHFNRLTLVTCACQTCFWITRLHRRRCPALHFGFFTCEFRSCCTGRTQGNIIYKCCCPCFLAFKPESQCQIHQS